MRPRASPVSLPSCRTVAARSARCLRFQMRLHVPPNQRRDHIKCARQRQEALSHSMLVHTASVQLVIFDVQQNGHGMRVTKSNEYISTSDVAAANATAASSTAIVSGVCANQTATATIG